jgi:hypothetical protein
VLEYNASSQGHIGDVEESSSSSSNAVDNGSENSNYSDFNSEAQDSNNNDTNSTKSMDVVDEILNDDPTLKKCSYWKCILSSSSPDRTWQLLPCANAACKKVIHCLSSEHFLSIPII